MTEQEIVSRAFEALPEHFRHTDVIGALAQAGMVFVHVSADRCADKVQQKWRRDGRVKVSNFNKRIWQKVQESE